ncbi:MAG: hypothetical protein V4482_03910 [Pseudomonadota bacterium]
MKLFFAWIESNEVFVPEIHMCEDLRIFKCVISQRETEAAVARLLTDSAIESSKDAKRHTKEPRHGIISFYDGTKARVLMRGKLVHIPRYAADGLLEWELNAEAVDAAAQINRLVEKLKADPTFESGFYTHVGLADVLESRMEIMCWDRETGRLALSNILHGTKHEIITDEILGDSLVVKMGVTPVNAVHVTMEVNWQQRYTDVINLAPLIARKFTCGIINTLTIGALAKSWPHEGDKIGLVKTRKNTGYHVVKSWLKRLPKGLNGFASTTVPLYMSENGKEPRLRTFHHGWFKGCLWVNWEYKQPCREVVEFSMLNASPVAGGQVRHLQFRLADADAYLEKASAATVLRTDRGNRLLTYAKRVAQAHIVGASRQLEVEFCVPFERLWHVNLDTTLDVAYEGLPGGRVVGKVISYQLRATSKCWVVWVKIAAAMDAVNQAESADHVPIAAEFVDDCISEGENDWPLVKVSGDVPRDPSLFRLADLVESIVVKGDGAAQLEVLQAAQYPASVHYRDALQDEAFSLEVQFMDLQPKPLCEARWERAVPIVVCSTSLIN